MAKKRDMTVGNPTKALVVFALPLFLGQLFQQLYNVTDTKVIGIRLGDDGLDAMMSVGSVYGILMGIANGLNNGCAIIAARMYGAKNSPMLRRTIAHMLVINFSVTAVFMLIGIAFVDTLMAIMKVPADVYDNAKIYLVFILCGMITTIAYNMCASILRAVGDSKTPLFFLIGCSILNVALDVLFVLVLPFGIGGAAAATIISQATSAVLCLFYIRKRKPELRISRKDFVFDGNLLKDLLSMGLSMSMITSLVSFGSAAVMRANNALSAAGYGSNIISASGSAKRVDGLFMMPLSTLGMALSTFVSQNLGAGHIERVRKAIRSALLLGCAWAGIGITAIYIFGEHIVRAITSSDSEVTVKYAVMYMKINSPFFIMLLLLLVFRSVLQGLGKKIVPIGTAAAELILKFFAATVLVPYLGFLGICVAEPIIWTLTAIAVSIVYIINIRKLMKAKEETV